MSTPIRPSINTTPLPMESTPPIHPNEPPRVRLAELPTPLVELRRLPIAMGIPRLLLKRDDLTGLEATGNKIRKLEYLVADALERGADTLVTYGGWQSNSCRATAVAGVRAGLRVRLLLRSPEKHPQVDGNLFLDHLFNADISFNTPQQFSDERQRLVDTAMDHERAQHREPYYFPVGGSTPVGCWGYIRAIWELTQQIGIDQPVDLFCPTCSMGTHVGLILGKALFHCDNWHIWGVPVSDTLRYFEVEVRRLLDETIGMYNLNLTHEETPIHLVDGFIGEGYAIPFAESLEAIRIAAKTEAILLDPTYASKALAGTIEMIRLGRTRQNATPVFIHTGGAFGLMARRDLFNFGE